MAFVIVVDVSVHTLVLLVCVFVGMCTSIDCVCLCLSVRAGWLLGGAMQINASHSACIDLGRLC